MNRQTISGMIDGFHIERFGCLHDVEGQLTPLHAFIGPNDSGKSTLLRAIGFASQLAGGCFSTGELNYPLDPGPIPRRSTPVRKDERYRIALKSVSRQYTVENEGLLESYSVGTKQIARVTRNPTAPTAFRTQFDADALASTGQDRKLAWDPHAFGEAAIVRFDADKIREPSGLVTRGNELSFIAHRGLGLAAVLQTIMGRGDGSFEKMKKDVCDRFPAVKTVGFYNHSVSAVALQVTLLDGRQLSADEVSEGLLFYLGFLVLAELYGTSLKLLLVEEPENGLHPSRIADVVAVLRSITERGIQVLMATHSPLVVNELRPDEVTVVTRKPPQGTESPQGTTLTPISDTPHFEDRSKVYALGELWLSYADGELEAPLLDGLHAGEPEP